jgi:hypothetical protein
MWKRTIVLASIAITAACHHQENLPPQVESQASLCEILKQKVEAEPYDTNDPATMKRKNAVDEAKQIKEYKAYGCPEILDEAPSP